MSEHPDPAADDMAEPEAWDHRYCGDEQVWSGNPNVALVAEVTGLTPGAALDVGCGEGADAVWLAERGWRVTGLDVSGVALDRARRAGESRGVDINWMLTGLLEAELAPAGFDLVSAFYPALRKTEEGLAERRLMASVAPGGTLLVVHHAEIDREMALERGFDPDDYLAPDDVRRSLTADFEVRVFEQRERNITTGGGAHHKFDVVLAAVRVAS
jgi:SAM-dependent methyltransferase